MNGRKGNEKKREQRRRLNYMDTSRVTMVCGNSGEKIEKNSVMPQAI